MGIEPTPPQLWCDALPVELLSPWEQSGRANMGAKWWDDSMSSQGCLIREALQYLILLFYLLTINLSVQL